MVFRSVLLRGAGKYSTNVNVMSQDTSRPVKPVTTLLLLRTYARVPRRQFPGTGLSPTSPHHTAARRRFLVKDGVRRAWPRRSGLIARGCPRATGTGPHPNKNRLVAPRVALGRLSRRRRRVSRRGGRRDAAGFSASSPTTATTHHSPEARFE